MKHFLFYYVKFVYQILLCVAKKKYIMYKDQDYEYEGFCNNAPRAVVPIV